MSETERTTPVPSEADELKGQVAALRRQATTLVLALIILSGTLNVYLYVEARRARNDLNELKPQATQMTDMSKREESAIRDFLAKLADYGKTHPDFMPILNRYRIPATNAPATTSAPPATPAPKPAPAPAPKK